MLSFGWQIALALELLVILVAFKLWFKAAKMEVGPKKLAKVVAIVVIVLALLLAVCTVTKAALSYGEYRACKAKGMTCGPGMMGPGMGMMGQGPGGMPCCPGMMGGPGKGMMGGPGTGMMGGPGMGMMAGTAAKTAEKPAGK